MSDLDCPSCHRPLTGGAADCPNPWNHLDGPPRPPLPDRVAWGVVAVVALVLWLVHGVLMAACSGPNVGS